jgi:S-formylglutathione hydrolase
MLTLRSSVACFGGFVEGYRHWSDCCQCEMNFSVYVPPIATQQPVPVLYFLSGLTCTDENFMLKAGAQRRAAQLGILLVTPDTSPRGEGVPDEPDSWDFGIGAGFYVDATEEPWRSHYQMYSYITKELPSIIQMEFPILQDDMGPVQGIFGHSMGGHGALVCALRNPGLYRSLSAFAPIAAPMQCGWGQKALGRYLGSDREAWKQYDARELVQRSTLPLSILIDQGMQDTFLATQLNLDLFETACQQVEQSLIVRRQADYDHGYYFIASFVEDHLQHHFAAMT